MTPKEGVPPGLAKPKPEPPAPKPKQANPKSPEARAEMLMAAIVFSDTSSNMTIAEAVASAKLIRDEWIEQTQAELDDDDDIETGEVGP